MMKRSGSASRRQALFVALSVAAMVLPFGFEASAQATSNIEFLNPSSFALVPPPNSPDPQVPEGPATLIVSDQVPENPDTGDETYRLSAWVSGVPQNPAVEFELLTRGGVSLEIIDDVQRVGSDTFEADWDIPDTLPDGPYTLRATLAEGILGVDSVDQDIMIQRLAERAEITYPDTRSGTGEYGMYTALGRSAAADGTFERPNAIGNIENRSTGVAPGSGPGRVRAFYTLSQPGTPPTWLVCGTESASGSYPFGGANNGIRCTMQAPEHSQLVTAVALVANNTKANQPYNDSGNQSGDATRVEPYAQVPTSLDVVAGQSVTLDSGSCHEVGVSLVDQIGREVIGANLDAHAWGPHDRLKFGTGLIDSWSAIVPDRANHAEEQGMDCFSLEEDQPEVGAQGEHQVVGGPDVKHVEADDTGSDDEGLWGFQVFVPADSTSSERHTTYWELWLDEGNDGSGLNNDTYDALELCRSGLIGWDGAASSEPMTGASPSCPVAPPPVCEADPAQAQACPTVSPSPSPTPTVSPTEEPTQEQISIRASRKRIRRGSKVRLSGAIDADAACTAGRRILVQSRRGNAAFRNRVITGSTTDGAWSVRRKPRKTSEWRVVAEEREGCRQLVSPAIKVKVRRR